MKKWFFLIFCAVFTLFAYAMATDVPVKSEGPNIATCDGDFLQQEPPDTFTANRTLTMLSWNVLKEQRENWDDDFARLATGSDILAIQESVLFYDENLSFDSYNYSYEQAVGFTHGHKSLGTLVGVKSPHILSCGLQSLEPLIRLPKTAIISYMNTVTGPLVVVNVHSINFTLGLSSYREQLQQIYEVTKDYRGALILAGDFNTWSEKRQKIVDDLALSMGLEKEGFIRDKRSKIFGHIVDHVYFRGLEDVSITSTEITSSDHNPIFLSFKVEG